MAIADLSGTIQRLRDCAVQLLIAALPNRLLTESRLVIGEMPQSSSSHTLKSITDSAAGSKLRRQAGLKSQAASPSRLSQAATRARSGARVRRVVLPFALDRKSRTPLSPEHCNSCFRRLACVWIRDVDHPRALTFMIGDPKAVAHAARQAGTTKRVGPHTFRHSFATHLLEDGYDIRTVQALLGHADVSTTMMFTHVVNRGPRSVRSPVDTL
jgi:hypothetical protein